MNCIVYLLIIVISKTIVYTQIGSRNITLLPYENAKVENIKYNTPKKKQEPKDPYNMVVAKDGTGDFTTIQEAMYAAKSFPYERVVINVKNGVYNEKVHIYSWNTHVSLIGESKEGTIITFDDYFKKIDLGRNSTFHTSTLLVEGDDFIAKNLTVKNTAGAVGQAIALSVNANRCYFENCAFIGNQDTVYTAGEGFKQYFKNCYIEGTTDFIFGEATVLFEDCQIHNKSNSYITAASTPKGQNYGYVFKNCNLTADSNVTEVYLGRPWRFYAKTVFINCKMGKHIRAEGWHNWKKAEAEKFSFYAEYNCSGEGYKPESRVPWSHQLKKSQAKKYTKENILKSTTKWYQNL
ncbi:pectinesterase family protein [Aestuariibaculum lutulentum]|uniref:Pectinesterase n=1 Tax=Aestuariibaculum lutulentum TaxID=2920935 RepID=A0ABS9RFH8_9FLAO|nr:pectinesterase family protein [Aestuariibaculum lutulentum]MCH4551690.1 pectinesterase family protein [Aestuariibaculum lutulentum]